MQQANSASSGETIMILARKLRSAVKLYQNGGLSTVAESAWDQSRGYLQSNAILPTSDRKRVARLALIFNDRVDYPNLSFDEHDLRSCRAGLLLPYLRRQFFDVVRLADLQDLTDAEIPLVADSLYRRWNFSTLDVQLPVWSRRLAGTKAVPVLDMMARRVALRLGRLSEAGRALAPSGGDLATCLLRAEVYDAQGRLPEASAAFDAALRKQSDNALVRLPIAFHLLKTGRIWDGLANWGVADCLLGVYPLRRAGRLWRGEALGDGRLMILFEHGLGDMIQMSRFLLPLHQAHPDAKIIGRVPKPLVGLLARSFPFATFVPSEELDPRHDLYVASMQLPLVVGAEGLAPTRDYISLGAGRRRREKHERPRIGVCWRGHPRQYEATRSVAIESFARLFSSADLDFVVLLNKLTPQEIRALDAHPNVERPEIADFIELGTFVASCDLVVSVDTAVAHVAGAAGIPTLLLSRPDACWRWGPEGSMTPWYDTVEVLRHPGDMDWPHVLAQAHDRMVKHVNTAAAGLA